ncbi:hypothetical protein [Sphingomonas sp.]|uniref:hypothetical protein n=1 Tax=Sphingomonas sp. TaxID=28214 RepID=UPI0031D1EEF7
MSMLRRLGRLLGGGATEPASPPPQPAPPPPSFDYGDERIPQKAKEKIAAILASIESVEKAMEREQVPSFSQVDARQMRETHLPKLVQSYIDVPAAHRSEIFRKTGKSASFLLCASLDRMQERVDEILRNLAMHDIDAFTNNTRFINERYSDQDNPFG